MFRDREGVRDGERVRVKDKVFGVRDGERVRDGRRVMIRVLRC